MHASNGVYGGLSMGDVDDSRTRLESLGKMEWETLEDGIGWQRPDTGDEVMVNVVFRSSDGSVFHQVEDFAFTLGDTQVSREWNDAVRLMAKGQVVKLNTCPEKIRTSSCTSTDIYEVCLLRWIPKRDLLGDGSVTESVLRDGTGWERPGKLSEVSLKVTAYHCNDHQTAVMPARNISLSMSSPELPSVLEKSILAMKEGTIIELKCSPERTLEVDKILAANLSGEIDFQLELLNWFKIEDLRGDGKSVKRIVAEGLGWEKPGEGGKVVLELTYHKSGSEETVLKERKMATVGDGNLAEGLDRAVQSMKRGEKCILFLKSESAFKPCPWLAPMNIHPDEDVEIEVTMVDFSRAPTIWLLPFEEGLQETVRLKERGNELFKDGRIQLALRHYERSFEGMDRCRSDFTPEQKASVDVVRVQCLVNMAKCREKLGDITGMYKAADMAISIEPDNVKALYRRGVASMKLKELYKAQTDIRYASELCHGRNSDVKRKLKEINQLITLEEEADRKRYSKGFKEIFQK